VKIVVVTLFPEFFDGPLRCTVLGRAIAAGVLTVEFVQIRDFATNRHGTVDDSPYGGGAGMVMRAPELAAATTAARAACDGGRVVMMTPQGAPLTQQIAQTLAARSSLVVVCGRYEGIDERFVERHVDEELSLGDFVLSGGEPAALTLIDAIARLLPGALGNEASTGDESFSAPTLEYPQFTRPPEFEGIEIPAVLKSGDHGRVARWRRRVSLLRTRHRRPDLYEKLALTDVDRRIEADETLEVEPWMIRRRGVISS
jgi:tRNA (guanine37-N1)-methyltransferase